LQPWGGDAARARQAVRRFTRDVRVAMLANPVLFTTTGLRQLD
jgi:hypothetical protein